MRSTRGSRTPDTGRGSGRKKGREDGRWSEEPRGSRGRHSQSEATETGARPGGSARWTVVGVPPRREPSQRGGASHTEAGREGTVARVRKGLFGAGGGRKSLHIMQFGTGGGGGGRLARRTVVEISFPYQGQVCDLCEDVLETAGRCVNHLRRAHGINKTILLCARCGVSGRGRHGMACHAAKCMNTGRTPEKGIRCSMCERGFKTNRGLSLHMRAAHIEEYVAQAEVRMEKQQDEGKKGKWSEEEVAVLRGLMGEEEERRGILAEACALIPGRTKEQVRGKIRYMGRQVRAQAGPSQEEEVREMKRHLMVERSVPCNVGQANWHQGGTEEVEGKRYG
ncbi:unnamed protein product [Arctogadus glacialis]